MCVGWGHSGQGESLSISTSDLRSSGLPTPLNWSTWLANFTQQAKSDLHVLFSGSGDRTLSILEKYSATQLPPCDFADKAGHWNSKFADFTDPEFTHAVISWSNVGLMSLQDRGTKVKGSSDHLRIVAFTRFLCPSTAIQVSVAQISFALEELTQFQRAGFRGDQLWLDLACHFPSKAACWPRGLIC